MGSLTMDRQRQRVAIEIHANHINGSQVLLGPNIWGDEVPVLQRTSRFV
jgi:hypothetical protein